MVFRKIYRHAKRSVWATALWLYFFIGCQCAPWLAILHFLGISNAYTFRFIKAADRMAAAQLGFSGRNMLSSECAHDPRYMWMQKALDEIAQEDHCLQSMYDEGTYCSIRDRTLRSK